MVVSQNLKKRKTHLQLEIAHIINIGFLVAGELDDFLTSCGDKVRAKSKNNESEGSFCANSQRCT